MPVTIMIIDDDADDRELFCEAIVELSNNISCIACAGGEEALKLLKSKSNPKPDIIFLDLNMPRMSGKQCLAKIKELKAMRKVPVVIYSTSKMDKDAHEVRELGASAFLVKPSRQKDLMDAITLAINHDWDSIEVSTRAYR